MKLVLHTIEDGTEFEAYDYTVTEAGTLVPHVLQAEAESGRADEVNVLIEDRASETANWSPEHCVEVGKAIADICIEHGIPVQSPEFVSAVGARSPQSAQRMPDHVWNSYEGIVGAQHRPGGTSWGPGRLNPAVIVAAYSFVQAELESQLEVPVRQTFTEVATVPVRVVESESDETDEDADGAPAFERVLKSRMRGDDVELVQEILGLEVTGAMNHQTVEAVTLFQEVHGLEPTGEVDADTWAALLMQ